MKNSHKVHHCLCRISPQITNININNQLAKRKIRVSHSSLIRKGLKGSEVNRTCDSINGGSREITSTEKSQTDMNR